MSIVSVYFSENGDFLIIPVGKDLAGFRKTINSFSTLKWDESSFIELGQLISDAIKIATNHPPLKESEVLDVVKATKSRSWRAFAKIRNLVMVDYNERINGTLVEFWRRNANFAYANTAKDHIYGRELSLDPSPDELGHAVVDVFREAGVEGV